jgi:hypothetical protein
LKIGNFLMTVVLSLAGLGVAHAADAPKIPLHVNCRVGDEDVIGSLFCSQLQDAVARSPFYIDTVDAPKYHFVVNVVTSGNGKFSSEAVALTLDNNKGDNQLISIWVAQTGSEMAKDQASGVLAAVGHKIIQYLGQ